MTLIARGQITLRNINDAYNISVAPSSCVVHQDGSGIVRDLSALQFTISVVRAGDPVAFTINGVSSSTGVVSNVETPQSALLTEHVCRVLKIDAGTSFGSVVVRLMVGGKYIGNAVFSFTAARAQTNLPWIDDWDGRKTEIGGEHIVTPKIFAGAKSPNNSLSGVYIGPFDNGHGIRGYRDDVVVFEIGDEHSKIGGWEINSDHLSNGHISLNTFENSVNVGAVSIGRFGVNEVRRFGGVSMFWESDESFGFIGVTKHGQVAFSLGNVNKIGGWNFNETAIWSGRTSLPVMLNEDGLILSTDGLFGRGWFIKKDGSGVLGDGSLTFNRDGGTFASWSFDKGSIYSGTKTNTGFCENSGDVTISREGLRSSGWRLEQDGSGALAHGNISWGVDGDLRLQENLRIRGTIVPETTIITNDNFKQYCSSIYGSDGYGWEDALALDIKKIGSIVFFHGATGYYERPGYGEIYYDVSVYGLKLPAYNMLYEGLFSSGANDEEQVANAAQRKRLSDARQYIGAKLTFYNRSSVEVRIIGVSYNKEDLAQHKETNVAVGPGQVLFLECVIVRDQSYNWPNGGTYSGGNEKIGWVGNVAMRCDSSDPIV